MRSEAALPTPAGTAPARRPRLLGSGQLRILLPALALAAMVAVIFALQPRAMSYLGLRLLTNFSLPLVFAAMAQLCIIAASDIDLGIGTYVSLVNCIVAALLPQSTALGIGALALCVCAYLAMGALVHARQLPSIVVTLGASFVWLGLALLVLPTPGGAAPAWLTAALRWQPPLVPLPILVAVALAALGHLMLMRTSYGVVLRGIGGNAQSIERAGWSLLRARVALYGLAGVFGVLAGLALTGLNTTGDANVGTQYTLTSIAAVIVGGSEFFGGIVSPVGAVIGSMIMLLTGSLLSFLNVSTDWQLAVQGGILILVLALRAFTRGGGR
jgi:ribose/xylose/arabinose/galactoside ABC-type transport system permease subunit